MTYISVGKLTIIGSNIGLSPGRSLAIIRNSDIFIQENAIVSVVSKVVAILSQTQCVKPIYNARFGHAWHSIASQPQIGTLQNALKS